MAVAPSGVLTGPGVALNTALIACRFMSRRRQERCV
jgi:hypothetical protein